jgi:hypothetical protein
MAKTAPTSDPSAAPIMSTGSAMSRLQQRLDVVGDIGQLKGADWFLRPAGRPEIDRNHPAIGR